MNKVVASAEAEGEFAVGGGRVWRSVAERLRGEITSGTIRAEQRLDPELALAARYGVSRYSVRRALAELERDGLVRIEHGRGVTANGPISYRIGRHTRYTRNILDSGTLPARRIINVDQQAASDEVSMMLGVRREHPVSAVEAIGLADDRPISLGMTWIDRMRFGDAFQEHLLRTRSWTESFAAFGVPQFERQRTLVSARLPTKKESEILQQSIRLPILEVRKVDTQPGGRAIAFGITVFASTHVQLEIC